MVTPRGDPSSIWVAFRLLLLAVAGSSPLLFLSACPLPCPVFISKHVLVLNLASILQRSLERWNISRTKHVQHLPLDGGSRSIVGRPACASKIPLEVNASTHE